jgi:hypothetical protein
MDFPTAWAIVNATRLEDHDPRCSYAQTSRALLCDCHVLTKHPRYVADRNTEEASTMASGETTGTLQCPVCEQPVTYPVRLRHSARTEATIAFDLAPVREHMAGHEVRFTTELPPTAR